MMSLITVMVMATCGPLTVKLTEHVNWPLTAIGLAEKLVIDLRVQGSRIFMYVYGNKFVNKVCCMTVKSDPESMQAMVRNLLIKIAQ
jgi:hypothetical protein